MFPLDKGFWSNDNESKRKNFRDGKREIWRRAQRRVRQNFENDKKIEQKRKLKIRNDKKFKK
jgi:hypothetical protein